MSKKNLTMQDLLEAQEDGSLEPKGDSLEKMKSVAKLKEELAKKSKLIQWQVVRDVLVDKTVEMLDIPLLNFLLPAWKKYREITEFADPENYPPNETELVSLSEHTVAVEHRPYLQVTYRQLPVTKIEFTLEAELTLQEVVLQIRNGKIMAIHAGSVKGKGELLLEQQSLVKKDFGPYQLPGSIDLGDGVSLKDFPEVHVAAATKT